jgi:hypothetical protein
VAVPYARPAEHLHDQLALVRLILAAALRRRALLDVAHGDDDAELARLLAEITASDRASTARSAISPLAAVPLERLRRVFALSTTELRVLVLLIGLELDVTLRAQVRQFMADAQRPHPDVGLLAELLYVDAERERVPEELGPDGNLARHALVTVDRVVDTAFVLRRVRAVERVIELAHGKDVMDRELARFVEPIAARSRDELVLDGARFDELVGLMGAAIATERAGRGHPVLVLSGHDGAGRKTMTAAAAAHHGRASLRVRVRALPRDEAGLRELGPRLVREARLADAVLVLDGVDQLGPEASGMRIDELLLGSFAGDLHEGLRGVLDAKLATLGMRITWRQTWDDLVLPDDAVPRSASSSRASATVAWSTTSWGFGRKVAKGLGLSALFSGPPGTGKTMVAGLIAEELKLDLYQVDLSKVVEVDRRDREEPGRAVRRRRGRPRDPPVRRGRLAVRQAHRGQVE